MEKMSRGRYSSFGPLPRLYRMFPLFALCALLTACGGQVQESNEAAIENQAESLEKAANATTDQLINQIEQGAKKEDAVADLSRVRPAEKGTEEK
ncbi:MAG: hypothetical protein U1E64_06155 [Sphingomonadaceae bacterium]